MDKTETIYCLSLDIKVSFACSICIISCRVWTSLPNLSLDRSISCSKSAVMFIFCLTVNILGALFVSIGNFLALSTEFQEYSTSSNVLNLIVAFIIPWMWQQFLWNIYFAMLFALIQKMEEKLNSGPKEPTESWILDIILIYNRFQKLFNLPVFLIVGLR